MPKANLKVALSHVLAAYSAELARGEVPPAVLISLEEDARQFDSRIIVEAVTEVASATGLFTEAAQLVAAVRAHLGPVDDYVAATLASADGDIRRAGVELARVLELRRLAPMVEVLAFKDEDNLVRIGAAEFFGDQNADSARILLRMLLDLDISVRIIASRQLIRKGRVEDAPTVAAVLSNEEDMCARAHLLGALYAMTGDPVPLIRLLEDMDSPCVGLVLQEVDDTHTEVDLARHALFESVREAFLAGERQSEVPAQAWIPNLEALCTD